MPELSRTETGERRYQIGTYEPTTGVFTMEHETDSLLSTWVWEQRIGWREFFSFIRHGRPPRLAYTAYRLPLPSSHTNDE